MRAAIVAARPLTYDEPGFRSNRFGAGSITASRADAQGLKPRRVDAVVVLRRRLGAEHAFAPFDAV